MRRGQELNPRSRACLQARARRKPHVLLTPAMQGSLISRRWVHPRQSTRFSSHHVTNDKGPIPIPVPNPRTSHANGLGRPGILTQMCFANTKRDVSVPRVLTSVRPRKGHSFDSWRPRYASSNKTIPAQRHNVNISQGIVPKAKISECRGNET